MSNFILSCCSTADLSAEHFAERNLSYICFHFSLNGVSYPDDLGKSIPFEDFYKAMEEDAETKTSQINVDEFIEYFTPFLQNGQDILHISLSSGLSGAYHSAEIAAKMLAEQFPERKIYIVDSLAASSGYGLLMDKLADLRDEGLSIDEIRQWTEEHKTEMQLWFFSTDLKYFVKGGRISKSSGFVGTLLGICPLLNVDKQGKLVPRAKIRSKKRVINEIVERMKEHAKDKQAYNGKCYISQSACLEDAKAVSDLVEEAFPNLCGKPEINYIGTTIGSHTGPGTVALFFWGDSRQY